MKVYNFHIIIYTQFLLLKSFKKRTKRVHYGCNCFLKNQNKSYYYLIDLHQDLGSAKESRTVETFSQVKMLKNRGTVGILLEEKKTYFVPGNGAVASG